MPEPAEHTGDAERPAEPAPDKYARAVACPELLRAVWPGVREAARAVGGYPSDVYRVLDGRARTAGGVRWRWASAEEAASGEYAPAPGDEPPAAVACDDTGEVFPSYYAAAAATGAPLGGIWNCVRGTQERSAGLRFRRATLEEAAALAAARAHPARKRW